MTHELHTNDEPQRILLEASERIKACYPPGTRIEVKFSPRGAVLTGIVSYFGMGQFMFQPDGSPFAYPFDPATDPHRVLPLAGSVGDEIAAMVTKLAQAQKPFDPDVAKILREHWDELFDDAAPAPKESK